MNDRVVSRPTLSFGNLNDPLRDQPVPPAVPDQAPADPLAQVVAASEAPQDPLVEDTPPQPYDTAPYVDFHFDQNSGTSVDALRFERPEPAVAETAPVETVGDTIARSSAEFDMSILDSDVGAMLTPFVDQLNPEGSAAALTEMLGDKDRMKSYVDMVADQRTTQRLSDAGYKLGDRLYNTYYDDMIKAERARASVEFDQLRLRTTAESERLAARATPEGEAEAEAQEDAGFFTMIAAQFGGGVASSAADNVAIANAAIGAFGDETFASDTLTSISAALGGAADNLGSVQTQGYQDAMARLEAIGQEDSSTAQKVVDWTGTLLSNPGDTFSLVSGLGAQSAGWLFGSFVTGGGVVGVGAKAGGKVAAKQALKSTVAQKALTSTAATSAAGRFAAAAGSRVAAGVPLAASAATTQAGAGVRETYERISTAIETNPDSVRATPGWQSARLSLEQQYGREPTVAEVDERLKRRIAWSAARTNAAVTFAGTVFAPFTEGALLRRTVGKVAPGAVPAGGRTQSRVVAGLTEAVAEGAEEYAQTIAPEYAIRRVAGDQDPLSALNDSSSPEAVMGAYLGSVLGGAFGATFGKSSAPATVETETEAEAAPAAAPAQRIEPPLTKMQESIRDGAETAHSAARAALGADHGVTVSENARFGIGSAHTGFDNAAYDVFFSDGDTALALEKGTGDLVLAARKGDEVTWGKSVEDVPSAKKLADAADAILLTASVEGTDFDPVLVEAHARRVAGERLAGNKNHDPLHGPIGEPLADEPAVAEAKENLSAEGRAVRAMARGDFGGVLDIGDNADLSAADFDTYATATRVRLTERLNWYTDTLDSKPDLAREVGTRIQVPQGANPQAVSDFLNQIVELESDAERLELAEQAAYGSDSDPTARAAAEQTVAMLRAQRRLRNANWLHSKTQKAVRPKTVVGTIREATAADPLIAQGQSADPLQNRLFTTQTTEDVVNQLDTEAAMDAFTADPQSIDGVTGAVATVPDIRVYQGSANPFVTARSAQSTAALRDIVSQRLVAGGRYVELLSGEAGKQTEEQLAVSEEMQAKMNDLMVTYSARRMGEGATVSELASELIHAGGIGPRQAADTIKRAQQMDPAAAPQLERAQRAELGEASRNAVSDVIYDNPIDAATLSNKVAELNRKFGNRALRFRFYETEAEYLNELSDTPLPKVGTAAAFHPGAKGKSSQVVFIRERIGDEAQLDRLVAHEVGVHYGLRELMTEDGVAQLSSLIVNNPDKQIRNIVNATRRRIVKARVAAREEEYRIRGVKPPSDLKAQEEAAFETDPDYAIVLGEETLAEALELIKSSPTKRGSAAKLVEKFRKVFTADTDIRVANVNDMVAVIAAARTAAGTLGTDWMQGDYRSKTHVRAPRGFHLSWFEKFRESVFDEQAPLQRLVMAADQLFGLSTEAEALNQAMIQGPGLRQRMASGLRDKYLAPMLDQINEVRDRLNMDNATFRQQFNQYLYLLHSQERIEGYVRVHGAMSDPEKRARREAIIAESKVPGTTDQRLEELNRELKGLNDPAIEAALADPEFGAHLVGRTQAQIKDDLARLRETALPRAIDELDLFNPETGLMRKLTEDMLDMRRRSTYGSAGYGITRLYGWKNYVPMSDYEGEGNVDGEPTAIIRSARDALKPGAWPTKVLEGRTTRPDADIIGQLDHQTERTARDLVENDFNRALANVALETKTETDADGNIRVLGNRGPREGLDFIMYDIVRDGVPLDEIDRVQLEVSRNAKDGTSKGSRGSVKVAWNEDGTATVFAIKDQRTLNAVNARDASNLGEDGALWKTPFNALRGANRLFASSLTAWNPKFVILAQLPRDIAQGMLQAGFEQNLGWSGVYEVATNTAKLLPHMQRFFLMSGQQREASLEAWRKDKSHPMHGFAMRAELGGVTFFGQQLQDTPGDDLGDFFAGDASRLRRVAERVRGDAQSARRIVESLSNAADNATRQALNDAIVSAEMAKRNETGRSEADIRAEASEIATNMMNFSQRSSVGRSLSYIMPFAQTALTGTDAIFTRRIWNGGRAPIEQVVQQDGSIRTQLRGGYTMEGAFGPNGWGRELNTKMLAAIGSMGVGSAMAGLAAMQGLVDSGELTPEEREDALRPSTMMSNYILPAGEGSNPMRIPIQYGLIGMVHSFGTAMVLLQDEQYDPKEVMGALREATVKNLTPLNATMGADLSVDTAMQNFIPALFMPFVQLWANENAFGGRIYQTGRDGEARGVSTLTPSVNFPRAYVDLAQGMRDLGMAIDEDLDWDPSPEVIRHYVQSFGGGVGQMLQKSMEMSHRAASGDPTPFGDQVMQALGVMPSDPRYAHTSDYYSLKERYVDPILARDYERALIADRRNGFNPTKRYTIGSAGGGAALEDFYRRYGGRANIKALSQSVNGLSTPVSSLKKRIDAAIHSGNTELAAELNEDLKELYRSTARDVRETLTAMGVDF